MVERVCPDCEHGNPLENRFCGRCGATLERQLPAPAAPAALSLLGRNLPVPWRQVGRTVAVGLAALAAEAGMAWLRRRVEHVHLPPAPNAAMHAIIPRPQPAATPGESVTIASQRVLEVWEHGTLTRQVVERTLWRKESGQ